MSKPPALMRSRAGAALLVVWMLAAASGSAAAQGPQVLADDQAAVSKVSAYGDVVVWTARDEAARGHVLMMWRGGAITRVPVPVNRRPFDVDLGPGPSGEVVAVYSRCTRPKPLIDVRFHSANWTASRGCRIYEADLATGVERRIRATDARGASEYLPSVWGNRIAFARLPRGARRPVLVVQRRDGDGGRRRIVGGPIRQFTARSRRPPLAPGPLSLDLRKRDLAYVWTYTVENCPDGVVEDVAGWSEVRVASPRAEPVRVARTCNYRLDPSTVVGATWHGSDLLFAANDKGDNESTVMRAEAPFSDAAPAAYAGIRGYVVSFGVDGTGTVYASASLVRALDDVIALLPLTSPGTSWVIRDTSSHRRLGSRESVRPSPGRAQAR